MTTIKTWQERLDSVGENYITTSSDVHITMQCEIDELRAEVERLTKDAGRYRHMRYSPEFQWRNGPGLYWYLPRWNHELTLGERLDSAIDAAMQKE